MCVAGFKGTDVKNMKQIVAASKFVNIAKEYFDKLVIKAKIIKINGSVELAPLLKMSDVIVDIVESGVTLKENGLCVLEEIFDIYSVFIVNKASLK
ncbi:MAG: ATP phosphoribosyltransferase [Clostridia bacterium]